MFRAGCQNRAGMQFCQHQGVPMPRIEWSDSFSVGVAEIDAQHRQWITLMNRLHDVLMGAADSADFSVGQCLEAMVEYGKFHLGFEEELLAEAGYPLLERHRAEHDRFRSRLEELARAEEGGRTLLNSEVMNMMNTWLQDHILKSDMAYRDYLAGA
jgi:hemerythrin-like metal-binding protein